MKRLLRLLPRTPKGLATGGLIPPRKRNPDDVMLMLGGERVWRVIDGKLVEVDDRTLREFNKLREL